MIKKWKILGLISLFLIFAAAVLITIILWPVPEKKQQTITIKGVTPGDFIAKSDENRDEEKKFSLSPRDSLQTMEQTAAVVKKRFERIRAEKTLLADKEKLMLLLPTVPGWKMENSQYHRGGYGGEETTNLNVTFTGPDSRIVEAEIVDYGAAPAALQPLKMIFKMERDEATEARNGKVANYNGNLVLEEYNRKNKERQFSSIINNRYLLKLKLKGQDSQEMLQGFAAELFSLKEGETQTPHQ